MGPAGAQGLGELDLDLARSRMIRDQLAARGISDPRVLEAFRAVARDAFVPVHMRHLAYEDSPLPIGEGQTISQPYIVALTAEALALRGDECVLDVGTGSGYAAAILSRLAREVTSVERIQSLVDTARAALARGGFRNVRVIHADGSLGWPEHAPYDAIAVAASAPEIPQPLVDQLAPGGRLVIPVGPDGVQTLVRVTRLGTGELRREEIADVRFVPLVGDRAWR